MSHPTARRDTVAPQRTRAGRGVAGARRTALVATVLAVTGVVTGCGDTDVPVSPLPVQPPAAATPAPTPTPPPEPLPSVSSLPPRRTPTATVTSRRPPSAAPTGTRTPSTEPSPSGRPDTCLGAVRYDVVLAETELALLTSLCFATGGVLRIIGIGPGEVTVDREDLVSRTYEAGVVDLRFVRPGTVVVRIPQGGTTYPVTVVIR